MKKNFLLQKISVQSVLLFLCVLISALVVIFFLNNVNYFQIDFGWHIASTAMFQKFGLHWLNPNRFQGLITNLFYPPLEDIIVRVIHFVSHTSNVVSFVIYVCALIVWYWFGVYKIIRSIKHPLAALLIFVGLTIYFFLDKTANIVYFQWWWFFDLLFTWLTSQALWVLFFFLFIGEYLKQKTNQWKLAIFAILVLLSHLILGPVVFLLRLIAILSNLTWKNISIYFLSIGITSFFRLPFGVYQSLSVSSLITSTIPILFLLIPIIWLIFSYKYKHLSSFALLLTSILIVIPNYLFVRFPSSDILNTIFPLFHYYRFASISLLCSLLWGISLFDYILQQNISLINLKKIRLWWTIVSLCLFGALILHFGLIGFGKMHAILANRLNQTTDTDKIQTDYSMLNNGKKIFTVDVYRPIDFWIDSYFQYMTPWLPFVKWLFWESYKWNQLLSSYIGSLISSKNLVLDSYAYSILTQSQYDNLWDGFIKQYTLGWLIVAPQKYISYITPNISNKLFTTISSWTDFYTFVAKDQIMIAWVQYTIYEILPKRAEWINPFIRTFSARSKIVSIEYGHVFADKILSLYKYGSLNPFKNDYIIFDKNTPILPIKPSSFNSEAIPYTILWDTSYSFDLWTSSKSVIVRIPNLPWWNIKWEQWQNVSVFNWIYEKIVVWTWTIMISYEKPFIVIFSYILSSLSFLFLLYLKFIYRGK